MSGVYVFLNVFPRFFCVTALIFIILSLQACVDVSVTRVVQPITEVNHTEPQFMHAANVAGWISFADYVPTYNSVLTVSLYMQYQGRLLLVGEQVYKNTRLPVRYSFAVAPIQAGTDAMKIKIKLEVASKLKATASADYVYQLGVSELDLVLNPYQDY